MNKALTHKRSSSFAKIHDFNKRCGAAKSLILLFGLAVCLTGCAASQSVQFQSKSPSGAVTVPGDLYRPEGTGPFPAVIVLHSCGGVSAHDHDIASRLRAEGYVAIVLDSFSPRGFDRCQPGNSSNHFSDSTDDAVAAAVYLRSLPFVRGDRIGVIGFSLGATSILGLPSGSGSRGVKAGVSYYPICESRSDGGHFFEDSKIPLLLLLGELDNWSPASECVAKAKQFRNQGRTVEWKVYAGAHHAFDNERFVYARTSRPATSGGGPRTLQYDKNAASDSWKRLTVFLDQNLR